MSQNSQSSPTNKHQHLNTTNTWPRIPSFRHLEASSHRTTNVNRCRSAKTLNQAAPQWFIVHIFGWKENIVVHPFKMVAMITNYVMTLMATSVHNLISFLSFRPDVLLTYSRSPWSCYKQSMVISSSVTDLLSSLPRPAVGVQPQV